jgi:hypothetical protein
VKYPYVGKRSKILGRFKSLDLFEVGFRRGKEMIFEE